MTRLPRLPTTICLVLMLAGCYSHTVYHHVNPLDAISGKYYEDIIINEDVSVWLSAIESPSYNEGLIDDRCPGKSGSIRKAKGFTSALVQIVTLGIYHSINVQIGCERKAVTTLTITPEQARVLVADPRFLRIVRDNFPSLAGDAARAHARAIADLALQDRQLRAPL